MGNLIVVSHSDNKLISIADVGMADRPRFVTQNLYVNSSEALFTFVQLNGASVGCGSDFGHRWSSAGGGGRGEGRGVRRDGHLNVLFDLATLRGLSRALPRPGANSKRLKQTQNCSTDSITFSLANTQTPAVDCTSAFADVIVAASRIS